MTMTEEDVGSGWLGSGVCAQVFPVTSAATASAHHRLRFMSTLLLDCGREGRAPIYQERRACPNSRVDSSQFNRHDEFRGFSGKSQNAGPTTIWINGLGKVCRQRKVYRLKQLHDVELGFLLPHFNSIQVSFRSHDQSFSRDG